MKSNLLRVLESALGKSKQTDHKGNQAFFCPKCKHYKPKLIINLNTQDYNCFVCHLSGKRLVTLFRKINAPKEKIEKLYTALDRPIPTKIRKEDLFKDNTSVSNHLVQLPTEFITLTKPSNNIEYRNAIVYLKKRKITYNDIVRYNIGYCESGPYEKRIIFPSYDENNILNFFAGRSYYDGVPNPHKNPQVSKDIVGFENMIAWDFPIILTEGAPDAIATKRNAIPLFGKTISDALKKKIIEKKVKTIYVALDLDAIKDSMETCRYFTDNGIEVRFVQLKEKDPSILGFNKMVELVDNAQVFSFKDFVKFQLNF